MKKLILIVIVLVAVGVGVGAYYMRKAGPEPKVSTLQISRGDIIDAVAATGTLEAVTTVEVGTQVSGIVQELYADYNSIVKKGQVIARLDPSILQTQVEQAKANVTRSEADLERLRVSLADANQKLERSRTLAAKNLISKTDLETAEVNARSAEAQIKSSEASLVQSRSQLNTAQVNLEHATIMAPIDGIVIARKVEPGQTVAASMNAPVLFILAADLTQMKVTANIDEADVGRMRPGQTVTFRVDAFPTDQFTGLVAQVRLQPTTVQNVVTYQTVINVPNPERKLKPGMTANVNIEISRRTNVLRIPNGSLRFRPTVEMFAALNQEVPPEYQRMLAGGSGRGAGGLGGGSGRGGNRDGGNGQQAGAPASPANAAPRGNAQPATPGQGAAPAQGNAQARPQSGAPQGAQAESRGSSAAPEGGRGGRPGGEAMGGGDRPSGDRMGGGGGGRGGFDPNMTPEERQKRMQERLAQMTPEERQRFEQRMAERAAQGGGGSPGGGSRGEGQGGNRQGQVPGQGGGRGQLAGSPQGGSRGVQAGMVATTPSITDNATTIDSLFGPLPVVETRARAWLYIDKKLKMVSLRLGISDGTYSEILEPQDIQPGTEVVTNVVTGLEPTNANGQQGNQTNNPLMQQPQRGRPGGPGGGGGGRGGGR